jgi:carbamoyltransferase
MAKKASQAHYVLGISCYYHDSAAALVRNGQVIAAGAEERFSRIKHDNGFPTLAIQYCLDEARLAINELDALVFYEKPIIKFERVLQQHIASFPSSFGTFMRSTGSWFHDKLQLEKKIREDLNYHGKILYIPHHLSHAASAWYPSGFTDATIVTIDGVGEWATTTVGVGQRQAGKNDLKILKQINFPHSLGLLYSAITAYLGFQVNNDEYKVMGLAPYGDPAPMRSKVARLITLHEDGSFELNMKYFAYTYADVMFTPALAELFGAPPRRAESTMESIYENIAASTQELLEKAVINLLNAAHALSPSDNLCLAGGVALNSVMNAKLLAATPFKNLYIPPDPSDAGGAVGAALYGARQAVGKKLTAAQVFPNAYLGPGYAWPEIKRIIEENELEYTLYTNTTELLDIVSDWLIDQKVIGWFQGRMEWGPRALGNRSILASAAQPEMKDIINARVKHRELFRPFAPVILEEYAQKYFETDQPLPEPAKHMLLVYPFKKSKLGAAPATVHVDNTGRLQTINRTDNPKYYDLVAAYHKKTKVPIIINTSFNVRGEPIVCTPQDAINCFLSTDIDYLVMDNAVVRKK